MTPNELVNEFVAALRSKSTPTDDPVLASHREALKDLLHLLRGGNHTALEEFAPSVQYFASDEHDTTQRLAEQLEGLPIDDSGIGNYAWMGFVLVAGSWVPCYGFEHNERNGWAMCGVSADDGSTETIAARPGQWADCTADNQPCLPWVWDDSYDRPSIWDNSTAKA